MSHSSRPASDDPASALRFPGFQCFPFSERRDLPLAAGQAMLAAVVGGAQQALAVQRALFGARALRKSPCQRRGRRAGRNAIQVRLRDLPFLIALFHSAIVANLGVNSKPSPLPLAGRAVRCAEPGWKIQSAVSSNDKVKKIAGVGISFPSSDRVSCCGSPSNRADGKPG